MHEQEGFTPPVDFQPQTLTKRLLATDVSSHWYEVIVSNHNHLFDNKLSLRSRKLRDGTMFIRVKGSQDSLRRFDALTSTYHDAREAGIDFLGTESLLIRELRLQAFRAGLFEH